MLPRLASAYEREGSWEFLRNKPDRWFEIMRPDHTDEPTIHDLRIPSASDLTGALFRIALLDQDKKRVTGYPSIADDALLRPIEVDGKLVEMTQDEAAPFLRTCRFGAVELRAERFFDGFGVCCYE